MSDLTRVDAIRIIENITDKDDPAWEWAVEDFYDEDTDTMPTIYDVMSILGVTEDEYKRATCAQNTNWPEVELDYAAEKEAEIDKLQAQLTAANARVEELERVRTQAERICEDLILRAEWCERDKVKVVDVSAGIWISFNDALAAARGE